MSGIVSAILVFLKIVGVVMDRADASQKARMQKAMLDALRMEVEDEVADRARAAYAARPADGVQRPYRHFRD